MFSPGTVSLARLALGLLLVLSGCDAAPLSPASSSSLDPAKLEIRHEPIRIYPEATVIRLKVHDLGYDDNGKQRFSRAEGTRLTAEQRARLEAAFRQAVVVRKPPVGDEVAAAACFVPHHFFEYLDGDGRAVGEIAVCFCCAGAQFSPSVGRFDADAYVDEDIAAIKALVEDMGLPTDVECDE